VRENLFYCSILLLLNTLLVTIHCWYSDHCVVMLFSRMLCLILCAWPSVSAEEMLCCCCLYCYVWYSHSSVWCWNPCHRTRGYFFVSCSPVHSWYILHLVGYCDDHGGIHHSFSLRQKATIVPHAHLPPATATVSVEHRHAWRRLCAETILFCMAAMPPSAAVRISLVPWYVRSVPLSWSVMWWCSSADPLA